MIYEDPLNSTPQDPQVIDAVLDLPIRIEAALQVDYYWSDTYLVTNNLGTTDLAFYFYGGCNQSCMSPLIQVYIQVAGQTRQGPFTSRDANQECNFATLVAIDADVTVTVQSNQTYPNLRYAMVVTTGVPYIDDCDAAFIDYDYINPPLPSTASDASGRSSCYEPNSQSTSRMGPYTPPFVGKSTLVPYTYDFWKFYVPTGGTYNIILEADSGSKCESGVCFGDPDMTLFNEDYSYRLYNDDLGPGLCPMATDYLPRGYYYVRLGFFDDSEASTQTYNIFFFAANDNRFNGFCESIINPCHLFILPNGTSQNPRDNDDWVPLIVALCIIFGIPLFIFLVFLLFAAAGSIGKVAAGIGKCICCPFLACYACCKSMTRGARRSYKESQSPVHKEQMVETSSDFPNGIPPDVTPAKDVRDPEVSTSASSSKSLPVVSSTTASNVSLEDRDIDPSAIYNQAINRQ